MLAIHTILHPTDFSPRAEAAFKVAAALARDYHARLIVAHVVHFQTPVVGEFGVMPVEPEENKDVLRTKLAEFHAGDNVPMERHLLEGDPVTEIIDFSREANVDVIVLGTHGRTGLGRLLMGSVAEQVVRRAPCMVLTVKAHAAAHNVVEEEEEVESEVVAAPL